MNLQNYSKLKANGHVTIGDTQATNEELLKVYVKDGKIYTDQITFDSVTGEKVVKTGVEEDLRNIQNQYGQILQQRAELKTQLEQIDKVVPEYKAVMNDLEALLESVD